ncbi:MAG: PEP/pyruvate-binding domain-containing protein, partial [Candidatus Palauibacterales bacterium]|nr:PEP/pyruvate-binding domain-containing protein [Candidatus Palauibacterales bacterium]
DCDAPTSEIGGKGAGLVRLMEAGLEVPPGFVLGVTFFAPWLEALHRHPAWPSMRTSWTGWCATCASEGECGSSS